MKKMILLLVPLLLVGHGCLKNLDREVISTPQAPAAIGPFSQAIRVGHFLYLSGQLGIDPKTGKLAGQDFASQARQALENQKAILEAAGFTLADVVQCQVFVKDLNNYAQFNALYKEYFTGNYPARAVLEVSRIPMDGQVEIMMVAARSKKP